MSIFPKFFLSENLSIPDSLFVIHIYFPKFMIEFPDERIIWLEDNIDELTKLEHKEILSEAIDWILEETNNVNQYRLDEINYIKSEAKKEFIKNFN